MMSGLTLNDYAQAKGLNVQRLSQLGIVEGTHNGQSCVDVPYYNEKGEMAFVRKRLALDGKMKFWQPTGIPLMMYGLWLLDSYDPTEVWIVEGESDFHTLYQHGFQVVALPGAGSWKDEWATHLNKFQSINFPREPDQGGDALKAKLINSPLAYKVRELNLPNAKDISEFFSIEPDSFVSRVKDVFAEQKNNFIKPSEFKTLGELMAMDLGEPKFFIDKLVPEAAIVALSGAPASYKTFISDYFALCVTMEELVFGKFATQSTPVLIIDNENGPRILQRRMRQLMAGMGKDPNELDKLPIHWACFTDYTFHDLSEVMQEIERTQAKLVIWDSFVRFLGGADENDSSTVAEMMKNLMKLKEMEITSLLLHHNRKQGLIKGKGAEEMRGSSDISAALSSHLAVTFNPKKDYIEFYQHKLREDEPAKPFVVNLTKGAEGALAFSFGGDLDEQKSTKELALDAVMEILGDQWEPMKRKDLIAAVKSAVECSERTVATAINELGKSGEIEVTKEGRESFVGIPRDSKPGEDEQEPGTLL